MSRTKIGLILITVSFYVMVLIPILIDPKPILTAALWFMIMISGLIMIMNDYPEFK
jgi:hypothetical protein